MSISIITKKLSRSCLKCNSVFNSSNTMIYHNENLIKTNVDFRICRSCRVLNKRKRLIHASSCLAGNYVYNPAD